MIYLKRLQLFSLAFVCCVATILAQSKPPKLPYEKVYVHTDRDTYASGEDLWFKAYLVNAQSNLLTNNSNNLYVELLSPSQNIVFHHIIRLNNGLGHGDIKLPDTLKTGNYSLRAYTNWMRNFSHTFIFNKSIAIVNPLKPNGLPKPLNTAKSAEAAIPPAAATTGADTVRFFPEGGSLIEGVSSVVAVKAENPAGRGIPVRGTILSSGAAVATFTCDSVGMGLFKLLPIAGKTYEAVATINGKPQYFKLPGILSNGFALSVSSTSKDVSVAIACNAASLGQALNKPIVLKIAHSGNECYNKEVQITSSQTVINIPLYNLPEGVACITLYNPYGKPLTERLYYVTDPLRASTLRITPDEAAYAAHEPVTLKIKVDNADSANLSVAVVDAIIPPQKEDMVGYLNISSEIKGPVEHIERYFDNSNPNRMAQLNLLMLTQGWREYIWKQLEQKPANITRMPEQGITLTGVVRRTWRDKPLPNMNITLFANNATGQKLFTAKTDAAGRFTIPGVELYGYQYLNFTSRTNEGKNGGWIKVDSLVQDHMEITAANLNALSDNNNAGIADTLVKRETRKRNFTLKGVNELEAVTVKGYSAALPSEEYGITSTEHKEYDNLAQYLLMKIPGSHSDVKALCKDENVEVPIIYRIGERGKMIIISISGMYTNHTSARISYCDNNPLMLSMDKILKVTLLKRNSIEGVLYSVFLTVRPGAFDTDKYFSNAVADVSGYYKARTFYTPRYTQTNPLPDLRTTLHWQPNVITNANGEATVTYQNTNAGKSIRVVVQGITGNGVPVAATTSYVIK